VIDKQAILNEIVELSGTPKIPIRDYEFTAAQYSEAAECSVKTAKKRLDKMARDGALKSAVRRDEYGRFVTAYWRPEDEEENHA